MKTNILSSNLMRVFLFLWAFAPLLTPGNLNAQPVDDAFAKKMKQLLDLNETVNHPPSYFSAALKGKTYGDIVKCLPGKYLVEQHLMEYKPFKFDGLVVIIRKSTANNKGDWVILDIKFKEGIRAQFWQYDPKYKGKAVTIKKAFKMAPTKIFERLRSVHFFVDGKSTLSGSTYMEIHPNDKWRVMYYPRKGGIIVKYIVFP